MKKYEFDAVLLKHEKINATFVEFPLMWKRNLVKKHRSKVYATFDGGKYRGSIAKMGYTCHVLRITQNIRQKIGKNPGDTVHVVLWKDTLPRIVELPEDFIELLDQYPVARELFDSMSYTHKKKYVDWIEDVKRDETRKRRIQKSVDMITG